ncbi:MAG: hypothetical protein HQ580_15185 [Planctomycetes bacterium]|nr:hypothetical protein [Planctomycetota bacterium]
MTDEQEGKLTKAAQLVKQAFPNTYGSVKFNLSPDKKKVKVKVEADLILEIPEQRNKK